MISLAIVLLLAKLPLYFPLPPGSNLVSVEVKDDGEAEFVVPNADAPVVQHGKLWTAVVMLSSVNEDAAPSLIWSKFRPTAVGAGWGPIVEKSGSPYVATLRYQNEGRDAWASVKIFNADDIRIAIVQVVRR